VPENRPRSLWAGRTLAFLGILLVALNLRTAVAALSPIFDEISADIPLGSLGIGFLGMLPPICFAVFGILAPVFHRRFGLERVLIVALCALVAGHLIRALAGDFAVLAGASALTFAGMGVSNVLLPPLVKKYFPDRIGLLTSLYVTVLSAGSTLPPLLAVPLADSAGWRFSVGIWSTLGLLSLLPWLTLFIVSRRRPAAVATDPDAEEAEPIVLGRVWHSRVAWALMAMFALTSLNAYATFAWLPSLLDDTTSVNPTGAGALLSLYSVMGLPASLLVPILASRMKKIGILVYLAVFFFLVGYAGLLFVPDSATWVWVAFAGLGPINFPLALVLINLRTRTHEGAVALSGFVQGIGYAVGALGPLVVGVLHDLSGAWTLPLLFLGLTVLGCLFCGFILSKPRMLEDDWTRTVRP
jgi:CP family cyanate transporter-like MFS transporter